MPSKPTFRELIDVSRERAVVGGLCLLPSTLSVELQAAAGVDFIFIDTEHPNIDRPQLASMLTAAELTSTPTLVRAAWNHHELVGWPLDQGAQAIMAPMVDTADDARKLARHARYAPVGDRSWGSVRPLIKGGPLEVEASNSNVVCIANIETVEGVGNAEEIISVDGIDGIWAGQSDLSVAYGLHPMHGRDDAEHLRRMEKLAQLCHKHQKPAFAICDHAAKAKSVYDMGYQFLCMTPDVVLLRRALRDDLAMLKRAVSEENGGMA
jgi:4-hydroxy-2-oxoheptanedioate aldolase